MLSLLLRLYHHQRLRITERRLCCNFRPLRPDLVVGSMMKMSVDPGIATLGHEDGDLNIVYIVGE